jgi:hypothetical protein
MTVSRRTALQTSVLALAVSLPPFHLLIFTPKPFIILKPHPVTLLTTIQSSPTARLIPMRQASREDTPVALVTLAPLATAAAPVTRVVTTTSPLSMME